MNKAIKFWAVIFSSAIFVSCKNNDTNTVSKTIVEKTGSSGGVIATPVSKSAGKPLFEKKLSFEAYTFDILQIEEASQNQLTIQPRGLVADNTPISLKTDPVEEAYIADLDGDQYPELLVVTRQQSKTANANVLAYTVDQGKSLLALPFPSMAETPEIATGYFGNDQFSIEKNQLNRKFEVFQISGNVARPSGTTRTVTYKIINENGKKRFFPEKVAEKK